MEWIRYFRHTLTASLTFRMADVRCIFSAGRHRRTHDRTNHKNVKKSKRKNRTIKRDSWNHLTADWTQWISMKIQAANFRLIVIDTHKKAPEIARIIIAEWKFIISLHGFYASEKKRNGRPVFRMTQIVNPQFHTDNGRVVLATGSTQPLLTRNSECAADVLCAGTDDRRRSRRRLSGVCFNLFLFRVLFAIYLQRGQFTLNRTHLWPFFISTTDILKSVPRSGAPTRTHGHTHTVTHAHTIHRRPTSLKTQVVPV